MNYASKSIILLKIFIIFAPNSEPQSHLTPSGQVGFAVFKHLWRSD
uniref:Uncharacterized protein n=1 Tax=virus sp. ctoYX9 TaxID=2825822 RepID=A0A8S5RNV2_9VIRU|nr:MAG TPA: hypothetical protein [virus sp. ctoYX9]